VVVDHDAINGEQGLGLDRVATPAHEWQLTESEAFRRIEEALAAGHASM
jgi:hypothetical protein